MHVFSLAVENKMVKLCATPSFKCFSSHVCIWSYCYLSMPSYSYITIHSTCIIIIKFVVIALRESSVQIEEFPNSQCERTIGAAFE